MSDPHERCPSCGTSRGTFLEGRLCPSCLLQLALYASQADEAPGEGAEGDAAAAAVGAEERYGVLAVMDDCADATAYLAEDRTSRQLVRLEVGKRPGGVDLAGFRARLEALRRSGPEGSARVLDGGLTPDGRPWLVTERTPAARSFLLPSLLPLAPSP